MPAQLGLFTGIALAVGVFVFFLTRQAASTVECLAWTDYGTLSVCDRWGNYGVLPANVAPGWYAFGAAAITFVIELVYKASQNKSS